MNGQFEFVDVFCVRIVHLEWLELTFTTKPSHRKVPFLLQRKKYKSINSERIIDDPPYSYIEMRNPWRFLSKIPTNTKSADWMLPKSLRREDQKFQCSVNGLDSAAAGTQKFSVRIICDCSDGRNGDGTEWKKWRIEQFALQKSYRFVRTAHAASFAFDAFVLHQSLHSLHRFPLRWRDVFFNRFQFFFAAAALRWWFSFASSNLISQQYSHQFTGKISFDWDRLACAFTIFFFSRHFSPSQPFRRYFFFWRANLFCRSRCATNFAIHSHSGQTFAGLLLFRIKFMIILWWNKESHFTVKKSNLYHFYSCIDLVYRAKKTAYKTAHPRSVNSANERAERKNEKKRNFAGIFSECSELFFRFAVLSPAKKIRFLLFNFHSSHRQVWCELIHWEKYRRR